MKSIVSCLDIENIKHETIPILTFISKYFEKSFFLIRTLKDYDVTGITFPTQRTLDITGVNGIINGN